MPGINRISIVKSTWGKIRLSHDEMVARKRGKTERIEVAAGFPELGIPLTLTSKLPNRISDAMLSIERLDVARSITRWIEAAGLKEDWEASCVAVVFCSRVEKEVEGIFQRTRGFVIEPADQEDHSLPCGLTESERKLLTSEQFLGITKNGYNEIPNDPLKTIFINFYISRGSRRMLCEHEFLPPLAYYLGYLSSRTDERIDPESSRYEFRAFYAALYELNAIKNLAVALPKRIEELPGQIQGLTRRAKKIDDKADPQGTERRKLILEVQDLREELRGSQNIIKDMPAWIDRVEERLQKAYLSLNSDERTLLTDHKIVTSPRLPFSIKLPV